MALPKITDRVAARLRSGTGKRLAYSVVSATAARLGLLLLAVILGRTFGPSDYGGFTFATSIALLLAQLATLGWPMLMNRLIPEMLRAKDWSALRGLRDAGDAVVIGASILVAGGLLIVSQLEIELAYSFLLAALLVIPFAVSILRRQQLAALRQPALGLFFDQGFGAIIAVVFVLALGMDSIFEATCAFAAGMVLGNLFTAYKVRKLLPAQLKNSRREMRFGLWMSMALPMLIGMSSRLMMNKMDALMLAPLAGTYESGLYGAAFRITFLLTFPQVVMMSVVTPLISEAFADKQHHKITRLVRGAMIFAVITAVPFGLLLAVFPHFILTQVFGDEFSPAAAPLVLLALAQTVASLSIPLQSLLTMGGRERQFGALNIGALGMHVALNLFLIPQYGATGAATATLVVYSFLALAQIWLNRRLVLAKED